MPEDWPDLERLDVFSDFSDFFFFFFLMSHSHTGMKESTWVCVVSESDPYETRWGREKGIRFA